MKLCFTISLHVFCLLAECWETPHLIHVAAASLSLVLFLGLATLAQMGEMELNPVTRNPMAMAHSK